MFAGSQFGAVLDMITDRSTTTAILCWLCVLYPDYLGVFQLVITLDWTSHYMHMVSSKLRGLESHKDLNEREGWLLRAYYGSKTLLFTLCAANDMYVFNRDIFCS